MNPSPPENSGYKKKKGSGILMSGSLSLSNPTYPLPLDVNRS